MLPGDGDMVLRGAVTIPMAYLTPSARRLSCVKSAAFDIKRPRTTVPLAEILLIAYLTPLTVAGVIATGAAPPHVPPR